MRRYEHAPLTAETVELAIDALRRPQHMPLDRQEWCADIMEALASLAGLPSQQELSL